MASKTGKKANAAAKKRQANNAPAEKDDGTRWIVMRGDKQVYPGPGTIRARAEHLNNGLLEPGELVQVA